MKFFVTALVMMFAVPLFAETNLCDERIVQNGCMFKMVPANSETVENFSFCINDPNIGLVENTDYVDTTVWTVIPASGQFVDLSEYFEDCDSVVAEEPISFGTLKARY